MCGTRREMREGRGERREGRRTLSAKVSIFLLSPFFSLLSAASLLPLWVP